MTDETTDPTPDDPPQAPTGGLVVTVPAELYAPPGLPAETVTVPEEIACQYDARIWRRGVLGAW